MIFSYLVINRQFRANEEIEKIKHRLGERYKRESEAYFQLWSAVTSTYRKLSELETGVLPLRLRDEVDGIMAKAEAHGFVTTAADEQKFYSFWQASRETAARAEAATTEEDRKAVWEGQVRALGSMLSELRGIYSNRFLNPAN